MHKRMTIKTVGLITYQFPHLKTEQVLQRLLQKDYTLKMYALPFVLRKPREVLFAHRPDQSNAVHPQVLAKAHGIPYIACEKDTEIDSSCDVYLVLIGKVLSAECVANIKVFNAHAGIIPSSRGLDAFKWAVYEMKPLGVTLHFIDAEIDAGKIIAVVPTNVYATDSLTTLARRHYENEIDCQSRFGDYLGNPQNLFTDIEESEAKRRMPQSIERELVKMFPKYVERYAR